MENHFGLIKQDNHQRKERLLLLFTFRRKGDQIQLPLST